MLFYLICVCLQIIKYNTREANVPLNYLRNRHNEDLPLALVFSIHKIHIRASTAYSFEDILSAKKKIVLNLCDY